MQDPDLWTRLVAHDFPRGFEEKLATEGGWTQGHARAVRDEYLRFVYLTQISDHPLTPPFKVDLTWHLHLSYTRDYWQKFCPDVLQAELHHDPCASPDEQPRYKDQYVETLALYQREFGALPSRRIWPTGANTRHAIAGGVVAGIGLVLGAVLLAMEAVGGNALSLLALVMIFGGGFYASLALPQTSRPGAAGCGGGGAGCGG